MNINDFIIGLRNANDVEKYLKKHVVNTYVNYEDKVSEADKIIRLSNEVEVDGLPTFHINSTTRYMLFAFAVIKLYTDIEIDMTNSMLQFNILEKNRVIDMLPDVIGVDYERFMSVVNMVQEDYMVNNRDIVSYIDKKFDTMVNVIGELAEAAQKEQEKKAEE